ncbi:hypothetical protein UlMin_000895 [Ulmus minor]
MAERRKIIIYMIANELIMQNMIITMHLGMMYVLIKRHYEKHMLKNRAFVRNETRLSILNNIIHQSDIECVNQLRMDRKTFGLLCELLRLQGILKNDGVVSVEEQVCMFLHILAHHVKNHTIRSRFHRSGETISRHFNSVLNVVLRLHGSLLEAPNPIPENCNDDRWRWFKNCLGALDGTYIKVHVSKIDKGRYRNRNGDIATNVLGVCDRDMKFIFVLPGWEGSESDSRVLRDAISRPNGLRIPTSYYYLVDVGYTNGEGCLAPYRGTRYHLLEWRNGCAPSNEKEYFNIKHASMRWAILRSPSFYPIKTQGRIIIACCLLHNLIRR